MSSSFVRLSKEKLDAVIAEALCPRIRQILDSRGPGHCIRVSDLDDDIIEATCQELRKNRPDGNIFILCNHDQEKEGVRLFRITSTKLIELRNPDEKGNLRNPLLVFIPSSLRTSAEDSFGTATFEALAFPDVYSDLINALLERISAPLRNHVIGLLQNLREKSWPFADEISIVRFLLTATTNGVDGETLGASLYELALVPDFKLFEEPGRVNGKILKNRECVNKLVDSHKSARGRVSDLGLDNRETLEPRLFDFFEKYDIQEPETWAAPIALDKSWWDISFDKWKFIGEDEMPELAVTILETDLPVVAENEPDEQLSGLIGQQVLTPRDRHKMGVKFEVAPIPNKAAGLSYFTAQIFTKNGDPVGKSKKIKPWTTNKTAGSVSLTKLNELQFEEGWHYVRILPWTADGDLMPLKPDPEADGESKSHNESEPFYVLPEGKINEDPPQRAIPIRQSLEHARFYLQLTALGSDSRRDPDEIELNEILWTEGGHSRKISQRETLLAKFGRDGAVHIHLSRVLKAAEQAILAEPEHPWGWRMGIDIKGARDLSKTGTLFPASMAMKSFLATRKEFFSVVRKDQSDLTLQGFPFRDAEKECQAYAEAYLDLLTHLMKQASGDSRASNLQALCDALAVDSVSVRLSDFHGSHHKEAILVSPTHPLRALWLTSWAVLGNNWIQELKRSGNDYIPFIRSALLEKLSPSSFPVGIPEGYGRMFTFVDNINPFWALYTPVGEKNSRGLMAEICAALGLHEPATVGADISGKTIAEKIERYLIQHPYVRELSANIFNPGAGKVITDALIALQTKSEYEGLRYNIRLFTENVDSPVLGEAFEAILHPESSSNTGTDAFIASTGSHLFSKLNLSRHSFADFRKDGEKYPAHISILLDVFPAEKLTAEAPQTRTVNVHGMIQDYVTRFTDDDSGVIWNKQPIVGVPFDAENAEGCFDLLANLSRAFCNAAAAIATNGVNFESVPVMTLGLNSEQREFIYGVHQVSDWVFTIDRNMGIEFFDHGRRKDRPDYLIDYVPSANQTTHNLIISSRSNDELEAMLKPVLESHGLSAGKEQTAQILANLRSLSGQIALKLISAPTQQSEALGLALARMFLEYQGALINQIIVPLDSHIGLYRSSGEAHEVTDAVNLQRTDLALFDLDLARRTMTCNLVEVKCYTSVGDLAAYNKLKDKISEQIGQSEQTLQLHFDPKAKRPDRPDRLFKSRELAQILRFYLERATRYGIFDEDASQEARSFLESIEEGYSLQFRRCALIFDFEKSGTENPDNEAGIEYHRIGKDLIAALLEKCQPQTTRENEKVEEPVVCNLSERFIPEVPKLDSAAFISPRRTRTTTCSQNGRREIAQELPEPEKTPETLVSDENSSKEIDEPQVENPVIPTEIWKPTGPVELPEEPKEPVSSEPVDVQTNGVGYDVMLGVNGGSPQYGLLGEMSGRKIALDMNQTHTLSLFGVQGGGKSYTLGTVIEMAAMPIGHVNILPKPLAALIFHYSSTMDYAPEFTSMAKPNSVDEEIKTLRERYAAEPQALRDILILTPADKVEERRAEYSDIEVRPIAFSALELKASHWKFLMGAVGSTSMYIRQIKLIMQGLKDNLTLASLREGIEKSGLGGNLKELANMRLTFAGKYIDDNQRLGDLVRPGRLVIVDLRDEYIEKDEALGLFIVMLQIFSEVTYEGTCFNKLVVFDEAHKYIENAELVSGLIEVVREMRHKGTSIMVASQDPPSVPVSLIELSTQIIMHKFNSPAWLKHIQKANAALGNLTSDKMSRLGTGEAYVWSSKASDDSFTKAALKIRCRPRVTQHGGSTKTAVKE
jgi:hypothetical protein